MATTLVLIAVAIAGGIAVAIQGQFMGVMDQTIGTRESIFITYVGGGSIMALVMLTSGWGNLRAWHTVPWYVLTSGVLGIVVVGTIGYVIPRLGLVTGFTLIVASQFILGLLIDAQGWFGAEVRPLTSVKLVGLALLLAGITLIMKK